MEVTGNVPSQAAKQQVWDAMMNMDNWKQFIPNVSKLDAEGDGAYLMEVNVDLGPIKGNQTIHIHFTNQQPPNSTDFEFQNSMIKHVKGNFHLSDHDANDPNNVPGVTPEGTRTIIKYLLDVDAGNPFFNSMLDGYKAKIQDGMQEMLTYLQSKAQ